MFEVVGGIVQEPFCTVLARVEKWGSVNRRAASEHRMNDSRWTCVRELSWERACKWKEVDSTQTFDVDVEVSSQPYPFTS